MLPVCRANLAYLIYTEVHTGYHDHEQARARAQAVLLCIVHRRKLDCARPDRRKTQAQAEAY
jgi:hypothetical protein